MNRADSHPTTLDVVGLGNAIVDVLAHTEDRFLEEHGMTKGTMTLVDAAEAERLYADIGTTVECSGGSAANTMAGLASLGSAAGYIGKLRDDDLGEVFRRGIRDAGVRFETEPASSGPATGRCLVLVSPDAQRTMQTFLGASASLGPEDVDEELIRAARVTYLEGYLWDPAPAKEAFRKAASLAHESGRLVSLSLSDPFCVDRHRDEFQQLLETHVDILFANEDEIISLFETSTFEEAVERIKGRCEWAALTRGPRGAVILHGDERVEVAAEPVDRVVDTTGAGDLFAAGFLHGLTRGCDAAVCGRIGGIAAAEVISHFGARPESDLKARISSIIT